MNVPPVLALWLHALAVVVTWSYYRIRRSRCCRPVGESSTAFHHDVAGGFSPLSVTTIGSRAWKGSGPTWRHKKGWNHGIAA
jgi:hypothetical protein